MSNVSAKFYTLFWNNTQCQSFFLRHREQLLSKVEYENGDQKRGVYLQKIVFSNSQRKSKELPTVIQRIDNRHIDSESDIKNRLETLIPEQKINQAVEKYLQKPIENIDKQTSSKLSRMRFFVRLAKGLTSEKRFINFLHLYQIVPKSIDSFKAIETAIEAFFEKEIKYFLTDEKILTAISAIDNIVRQYDNVIYESLLKSDELNTDVIFDSEDFNDHIEFFDMLYESGAIIGGEYLSYYECLNCPSSTFKGTITIKLKPGNLKMKCPSCGKELFYLVPYKIGDELFEHIKHKDGLLFHALCNLLETKGIPFSINQFLLGDVECDIVIYNKNASQLTNIIEVKMLKTNRPSDTTLSTLRTELLKFSNAQQKLRKDDTIDQSVQFHFVTNIMTKDLKNKLIEDLDQIRTKQFIHIHTIESMYEFITNQLK